MRDASRDLAGRSWTEASMTCTKTATGMRNDANGASTCNGLGRQRHRCFKSITHGAATQNTSFHIKRRTGTGIGTGDARQRQHSGRQ